MNILVTGGSSGLGKAITQLCALDNNNTVYFTYSKNLQGKEERKISNEEKLSVILEHIDLEVEEKGEKIAIKEMRKHLAYYIRNRKDASKLREKINKIEERVELENCLRQYFN